MGSHEFPDRRVLYNNREQDKGKFDGLDLALLSWVVAVSKPRTKHQSTKRKSLELSFCLLTVPRVTVVVREPRGVDLVQPA